jgi:class 3 adenylate cyclase
MPYREMHYRWEFALQSSPEALWPLVSDTNRFNRDTGVPKVTEEQDAKQPKPGRKYLRLSKLGISVEWEEQPFEWVRPYRFGVTRRYLKGPVAEMRVQAQMEPGEAGGTKLVYEVWARPRVALGRTAIRVQVGIISKRSFARAIRAYDRAAAEGGNPLYTKTNAVFTQGGRERLKSLSQRMVDQGGDVELTGRLCKFLEEADDLSLARIRPHTLADHWGLPRRQVLEHCLCATRAGLLDLQWDMICPHCRGAADTSHSLSGLRTDVFCGSCNIDFSINFEQSVELTFRPNSAVRHVDAVEFCVGGPQITPHIVIQQLLPPTEGRTLRAPLEEGRYRLRASNLPGGQYLRVAADGTRAATLSAAVAGWPSGEEVLHTQPELRLENATGDEQLLILERLAWSDQAATAAEVTALQMFRDLFANEALRPGEQISVGTLTVLFTDLRGSTQLYREIGDAPAFGRVMGHFDVLREAISEEDGALVKTIGDAVMAVFRRPSAALRAIIHAQKTLANPSDGSEPLGLKIGIHTGPCIAVTLNGRLDYFGCTVNMAARLEGLSTGGNVIVSQNAMADAEVDALIERDGLHVEPFEMELKGFADEKFQLYRISGESRIGAHD